jgi:small conductance mechanosensitive channel
VRVWVNAADYWGVRWDLTKKLKEQLEADGISIPFPQQTVHHVNQAAE